MIVFDFVEPAEIVYAMGFLDIDEPGGTVAVSHMTEEGMVSTSIGSSRAWRQFKTDT